MRLNHRLGPIPCCMATSLLTSPHQDGKSLDEAQLLTSKNRYGRILLMLEIWRMVGNSFHLVTFIGLLAHHLIHFALAAFHLSNPALGRLIFAAHCARPPLPCELAAELCIWPATRLTSRYVSSPLTLTLHVRYPFFQHQALAGYEFDSSNIHRARSSVACVL